MIRAAVVGGAGYIGGELLRILSGHPEVELAVATSTRFANRRIESVHPNLRSLSDLVFTHPDELDSYDVAFLAVPHGTTMDPDAGLLDHAPVTIDLSADFRLRDERVYERYYSEAHRSTELLGTFVLGLPELHRKELRDADRIAVPGCMATAAILALYPAAADGLLGPEVLVDARTGSSGSGMSSGAADTHSERSNSLRVFAPIGHRHEAEIAQATGLTVSMTATGTDAVRGVQVLCRGRLAEGVDPAQVSALYRRGYVDEPFVRVVAQRRGFYRLPEPKILTGSNFCDVGFAVEPDDGRVLLMAALDNLVKGGAGGAVQSMNVRFGWPERLGLEFPGLHPN